MEAPVVTAFDAGNPSKEDEIQSENEENSPSAARQEVNKPPNANNECEENDEIDSEKSASGVKVDSPIESPTDKKVAKRNVSFPAESPVIGYLDPPDPWKNVPNWKTEDLIKAYRLGCEKHGTRPLNKIIQQLSCIENVGERYEILSLKGERLDIKQSESLEEIFKHVRFRCLDLEAAHLDDETAVAIFDMVEYYESACKLNISFNKNIGGRGWQACSKLIRKTPCLTFIDAKNTDLNERVMPILGRSLRMGCYITRLHLQSVGLAGRSLIILVAALKMNEILKELFIGDNKLMSTDGVQVGNLLKFNHKLELLDLRNNHLQDVGVHHICDGLSEQTYGSGLLTLVLWNNQISFQAMSDVSQALVRSESLETLNLGHNPITNEGIHLVKDGLLKSKSLLKLGLSGTKVSCEGAVALAEVIADTPRLVRLDLQENDIKTAGLMALSLALKMNKSLSRLDLDKDTKKEQGIKDYAEQQRRLQQDIKTYLERNRESAHKLLKDKEITPKVADRVQIENPEKVKVEEVKVANREEKNQFDEAQLVDEQNEFIDNENYYIPSEDKISRPKLLFLPERSPESDLESPACVPDNISLLHPLETVDDQSVSLTLPTSSGQDLLSPQYCPKMTAKKLFSVTRVSSPTLGPLLNPLLDSKNQSLPISHICTPLSQVPKSSPLVSSLTIETLNLDTSSQVEVDSHLIQQNLESETLETYIQEIVDTEIDSTDLDAEVAETNLESGSALEQTVDAISEELSKIPMSVNRLSAGDGPVKDTGIQPDRVNDLESEKTKTDFSVNIVDTVSDQNNSCASLLSEGRESCANGSVHGSSGPASEMQIFHNISVSANSDISLENIQCKINSQAKETTSTEGDFSSGDSTLKTDTGEEVFRKNCHTDSSDTQCVPVSLGADPSDDQLDSIEIIPEVDINEINVNSDLNDEPAELIDCDSTSEISNSLYQGLTDSLCDVALPFDMENSNLTENDSGNNRLEKEIQDKDAKAVNKTDSANSRTNGHHRDSGISDSEQEQWNKVEKSDFCDNVIDQEVNAKVNIPVNKPDFHTSLSLNGLKQELASLIDEEGNPTKIASETTPKPVVSPDDIIPVLSKDEDVSEMSGIGDAHANGN